MYLLTAHGMGSWKMPSTLFEDGSEAEEWTKNNQNFFCKHPVPTYVPTYLLSLALLSSGLYKYFSQIYLIKLTDIWAKYPISCYPLSHFCLDS